MLYSLGTHPVIVSPKPPRASARPSRSEQAAARREEILEAALQLFSEQGFAATTTKEIAQRAGIREGLLYHYFPSKLGILHAVVTRRHTFVGDALASIDGAESRPAREVIRAIGDGLIAVLGADLAFARVIMGEGQVNAEVHAGFCEMVERVSGHIAKYLDKRIEAGELRADLATKEAATGLLGGLLMFFLLHQRDDAETWQKGAKKYARAWVDAWYRGARA